MLGTRLQRTALVAAGAILATVAALTLGRTPERTAPVDTPMQATEPDDLSAGLRRCAALDETQIEEAGCMAVWDESRRRFFGGEARPLAPAVVPDIPPAPQILPDTNRDASPSALSNPAGGAAR